MKNNKKIINIEEYIKNIEIELNEVLKNATYPELIKYIEMLPKEYESANSLFDWGMSYLNEYYKVINKLDKINTLEMEELKYKIYILYLKENYNQIVFTFNEFIVFSRILNITFTNYNHNKIRKSDKEPYQSCDEEIDYIVNNVISSVIHSPHPNAYEITNFKLKILLNILKNKSKTLLKEELNKIDLDSVLLTNTLSKKRIKELKEKTK